MGQREEMRAVEEQPAHCQGFKSHRVISFPISGKQEGGRKETSLGGDRDGQEPMPSYDFLPLEKPASPFPEALASHV